ncbi:MAG: PIN domain-containing protein [Pseudonocardiales bacterium]|nr:PIN domain-containing protein [Actinomycetota bacterium]PZS21306.1 MAG: PIN domain-containing protein [Pseudonocardiales bacterium]
MAANRSASSLPQRLILDSGAVISWSKGDARTRAILREAIIRRIELRVPVVVLAETLRGGARDAPVNRVLKAVGTAATAPDTGREAGRLLGRTGGCNTADALIAAEALAIPGSTILTSDPNDLRALLGDQDGTGIQAV